MAALLRYPNASGAEANVFEVADGLLTASPLAMREAAATTGLTVLDLDALRSPAVVDAVGFRLPEAAAVGAQ